MNLRIFFRIVPLAQEQSYDCPSASEGYEYARSLTTHNKTYGRMDSVHISRAVLYLMAGLCYIMMTSPNGNIFCVTGPLCGESPTQRPVTRSFDVFFDLRVNKRLIKQSWGWWFETPSRPLWCHCNDPLLYVLRYLSLIAKHQNTSIFTTLPWHYIKLWRLKAPITWLFVN